MQNIIVIGFSTGLKSGLHWWDWLFLIFGIMMFFPVTLLGEIGERTGWMIRWRHIFWLEVIVASLTVVSMILIKRAYPELHWFEPVGGFVFAGLFRGAVWFLTRSSDDNL